jgi:phosphate transport system protein
MLQENMHVLKKAIISYSNFVQEMIESSIKGLIEKNEKTLNEIINDKEPLANEQEMDIEEQCITIIAKFDPKAVDLRAVLMAMKISNDLERMADHAVNISQAGINLIDKPEIKPMVNIATMARLAMKMLSNSITAFVDENTLLANSVLVEDDVLDKYHFQLTKELLAYMVHEPATVERSFLLMKISHNLERIGDLSTNICEDVIYMVDAKVIKHNLYREWDKENDK